MLRLGDVGEHEIIRSLITRYLGAPSDLVSVGVGDDAALFASMPDDVQITVTVDACPTPVVDMLGFGSMRDWGRLAGVISLSDLAAMGASPLGVLSSTYMSSEMSCDDYELYLQGLHQVCREFHTPIIGGNLREGTSFAATSVALGSCPTGSAFLRSGAAPGEVLVAIGQPGVFWSAVLDLLSGDRVDLLAESQRRALFEPVPRLDEALLLRDSGFVTAAVDCSDGLGAGVAEICRASQVGAVVRFDGFSIDPAVVQAAAAHGVAPEKLLLAWGDWQLLVTVRERDLAATVSTLDHAGHRGFVVGETTRSPGIFEQWPGRFSTRPLHDPLASTRFEKTSYLQHGLQGYVNRLRGSAA